MKVKSCSAWLKLCTIDWLQAFLRVGILSAGWIPSAIPWLHKLNAGTASDEWIMASRIRFRGAAQRPQWSEGCIEKAYRPLGEHADIRFTSLRSHVAWSR